mmetsp:Transcript_8463/g.25433  ORF Transcript_8463/g.25433 Transcript_8463/m.25433 type:complete len:478 (-) Transcript_8463:815-2248(-)
MHANPVGSHKDGETYYKAQLETLNKERKALQERLEVAERENRQLRRTVYELSTSTGKGGVGQGISAHANAFAFDLDTLLNEVENDTAHESDDKGEQADQINFACKVDLAAHAGAVYSVAFSPCGRFLVSGSFDKSICVWSVDKPSDGPTSTIPFAHDANIVEVKWSSDSSIIFSGGYDRVVKEWDVVTLRSTPLAAFPCSGLVQAIAVSHLSGDLIFVGTTASSICCFDRRAPSGDDDCTAGVFRNDSMVNTLYLSNDGTILTSGDRRGMIKVWDVRKMGTEPIAITPNAEEGRPITHVHANPAMQGEEEGRLLAVNSYDNYLRVYDRGERLLGGSPSALSALHILRGHRNRNWPIKSSFFCGKDYKLWRGVAGQSTESHEAEEFEFAVEEEMLNIKPSTGISSSLLLATGSADGNVYLFDVSGRPGTARTVQVMSGHKNRCYAVDFHPHEPILASCSADFLIKLWTPTKSVNPMGS